MQLASRISARGAVRRLPPSVLRPAAAPLPRGANGPVRRGGTNPPTRGLVTQCRCLSAPRTASTYSAHAATVPQDVPPPPAPSAATNRRKSSTLLLVDAMGLAFRQYFGFKNRHSPLLAAMKDPPISSSADAAIAALTAASGPIPTSFTPRDVGALYGYASSLLNLCYVLQPTHVAACMDLGNKQSFRHALFPDYKSERKPLEDSLRWQLGHLSRVTRALGIQPVSAATFEADDVIGTLAHAACQTATSTQSSADDAADSPTTFDRVIILSSDKDFIQCVNERVSLLSPKPGGGGGSGTYVFLHAHEVAETVGVRPERFADYLVLLGDVVDGIPGVTGIGPVRAKQIVEQYASLEHAMHDIKTKRQLAGDKKGKASDKVCAALLKAEAQLPLWRDLATIRTNVPDLPDWEALRYHGPTNGAAASDKPNTAAARALAAAAAEAVSAVPLTAAQQMTADTVAALYREFSFPSLPSFVPAATPSSGVAVTASSSSLVISSRSSRSSSSSASSLPRLLTQAQWSHLQRNGTMAEPPAAGATTAATVAGDAKGMKAQPKKRASVSDEAEAPKPKTARSKKQKLNDKGSSRAPPMGLSVEQIDG